MLYVWLNVLKVTVKTPELSELTNYHWNSKPAFTQLINLGHLGQSTLSLLPENIGKTRLLMGIDRRHWAEIS